MTSRWMPGAGLLVALALVAASCSGEERSGGLAELIGAATTTSTSVPSVGSGGAGPDDGAGPTGSIAWEQTANEWQSGILEVPLDHDEPAGASIELALVRRPADDPSKRIGPLLLNPGGPGASGIELALLSRFLFPAEVLDRFDIIGFDPRGVADSTPVTCGDDAFLDEYTAFDPVPDSPQEAQAAEALIRRFAANCGAESGDLLPHLSTVATARDMDLIRTALGAEQITYVGFSYGTILGATYIEMFPDRVRAAVLDGAYSRSIDDAELAIGQALGFERSIDAFLAWCEPSRCDLASGGDPGGDLARILDDIDTRPLRTDDADRRVLTVGLAWTGVIMAMYSPGLWPVLDDALVAARDRGDGTGLLRLSDQYSDRSSDGTYANSTFAFVAIGCMDSVPMSDADEEVLVARLVAEAPRIGPLFASVPSPCEFWPVPVGDAPTGPFSAPDAPPLLVIATTGDPATPYEWGVQLSEELETATLISVEGDAHTAYASGIACVDDAVDAYLLDLVVPRGQLDC